MLAVMNSLSSSVTLVSRNPSWEHHRGSGSLDQNTEIQPKESQPVRVLWFSVFCFEILPLTLFEFLLYYFLFCFCSPFHRCLISLYTSSLFFLFSLLLHPDVFHLCPRPVSMGSPLSLPALHVTLCATVPSFLCSSPDCFMTPSSCLGFYILPLPILALFAHLNRFLVLKVAWLLNHGISSVFFLLSELSPASGSASIPRVSGTTCDKNTGLLFFLFLLRHG